MPHKPDMNTFAFALTEKDEVWCTLGTLRCALSRSKRLQAGTLDVKRLQEEGVEEFFRQKTGEGGEGWPSKYLIQNYCEGPPWEGIQSPKKR